MDLGDALMSVQTGLTICGTGEDSGIGVNWTNETAITQDNTTSALASSSGNLTQTHIETVQLWNNGGTIGQDISTGTIIYQGQFGSGPIDYKHGGASQLWHANPTPSMVNGSAFGVTFQGDFVNFIGFSITKNLIGRNFGFTIPEDATLLGIETTHRIACPYYSRGNITRIEVDWVKMNIWYEESAGSEYIISHRRRRRQTRVVRC